jgi:hypothetical protein
VFPESAIQTKHASIFVSGIRYMPYAYEKTRELSADVAKNWQIKIDCRAIAITCLQNFADCNRYNVFYNNTR